LNGLAILSINKNKMTTEEIIDEPINKKKKEDFYLFNYE
jgi:hypothetical protein